MHIFSSPDVVSAYLERLDATTLPFAIDAAYLLDLIPPRQKKEYVILDDACGTGAAVEWIIREFEKQGVELEIYAIDRSAVMMNEIAKRKERLQWGNDVRSFLMDAQVTTLARKLTTQALKFSCNTFTHVFMTFGIMLIPNYKKALQSIFRVLQRGGRVAITTWKCQGHWDYLTRASRIVLEDNTHPGPLFFHSKWLEGKYVAKLLNLVGFRFISPDPVLTPGMLKSMNAHICGDGRPKAHLSILWPEIRARRFSPICKGGHHSGEKKLLALSESCWTMTFRIPTRLQFLWSRILLWAASLDIISLLG